MDKKTSKCAMCTIRVCSHISFLTNTQARTQALREIEKGRWLKAKPVSSIIRSFFLALKSPKNFTSRAKTISSLIKFVERRKNWLELTCLLPKPLVDPVYSCYAFSHENWMEALRACACIPILLIACRMHQNIKYHLLIFD